MDSDSEASNIGHAWVRPKAHMEKNLKELQVLTGKAKGKVIRERLGLVTVRLELSSDC